MTRESSARWCGYCQRDIPDCACPPWMPNTGTDEQRKARGRRQDAIASAWRAVSRYVALEKRVARAGDWRRAQSIARHVTRVAGMYGYERNPY